MVVDFAYFCHMRMRVQLGALLLTVATVQMDGADVVLWLYHYFTKMGSFLKGGRQHVRHVISFH